MSACTDPLGHPHICACTVQDDVDFDTMVEYTEPAAKVSDEFDAMVQKASLPNLAALLKQGLDQGLITPQKKYN